MKKSIIASVIALGMIGGVAHAAGNNTVIFHGAVSDTTCDIVPSVNGQVVADSTIALGTVSAGHAGAEKEFVMKAKNVNDPACKALTNQQTATVSWASAFLNGTGLIADAASSTATDAMVLLESKNAKNAGAITASANIAEFTADKVVGEGLKFAAKAQGGQEKGTFQTSASFSIAYK